MLRFSLLLSVAISSEWPVRPGPCRVRKEQKLPHQRQQEALLPGHQRAGQDTQQSQPIFLGKDQDIADIIY